MLSRSLVLERLFSIFVQKKVHVTHHLHLHLQDWYYTLPAQLSKQNGASKNCAQDNLFDEKKSTFDPQPVSNAAKRLQNMWENILQLHDKQLFNHLDRLDILPSE